MLIASRRTLISTRTNKTICRIRRLLMNAEQTTGRVWNRRRTEKQRRLAEANMPGKVIPTDQLVSVLENL
ncbi:TPA: malonate decarboxylase subunit alpha, partial [Klebsiella pneumoniae]